MYGLGQALESAVVMHRHRDLMDQLICVWAKDVPPKEFAGFRIRYQFDQPIDLAVPTLT